MIRKMFKSLNARLALCAVMLFIMAVILFLDFKKNQENLEYLEVQLRSVRFDRIGNVKKLNDVIAEYSECRSLIEKLEYDKLKSKDCPDR